MKTNQRGMSSGAVVSGIVVLAILVIIGFVLFDTEKTRVDDDMMQDDAAMMEDKDDMTEEDDMMQDETMMDKEDDVMMDDEAPTGTQAAGTYEAYAPEKLSRANGGDVVLFFHAAWCPTCRAHENSIQANLDTIPTGLSILKVNYDTETALKQKYGVTYQHTFVQVDAEGNIITKWSGGNKLADIVAKVQ